MQASEQAYDLIKCFEGFKAKAYYCPGKKLTIGYGITRGVKAGDTITHEEAIERLKAEVRNIEGQVVSLVHKKINQNQFDALVSFTYNLGYANLSSSTLLKKINVGNFRGAAQEFLRWKYSKGIFFRGLLRRREAEKALFLKPA